MTTAYITAPSEDAAELARALVEERYAACVNRIPCESTYVWEGEVLEEAETILIAKTTPSRYEDLVSFVRGMHPHDVPCIERFEADDVLADYADWVRESTADQD